MLAVAFLTACSHASDDGGAAQGEEKVLRAGSLIHFSPKDMDPASGWSGWTMQFFGIAEGLLRLDEGLQAEPCLAKSCENVDELTWRLELRDDVTFSNGSAMTGEAVKACLERTYAENPRASETLAIDSIEVDGQAVVVKTEQPTPAFANVICDPIFSIYYVGDDVDYAADTPCTGPYKLQEFVYKDHTTLVANEHYRDGAPGCDRIVLNVFADDDSQTLAMQNGELDLIEMPAAASYKALVENGEFVAMSYPSTRADFVRFNMENAVVAEPAVRRAVSYCIDRDSYADVIMAGGAVPNYGIYSDRLSYGGVKGLDVAVDRFSTDEAAATLDAAGIVDSDGDGVRELADGTPARIELYNCSKYDRFINLADDLQSKLATVGVALDIVTVDYFLQDTETYDNDDPDMTIDSYGIAPTGDPAYFAALSFASDGSNNFGRYANAEVDRLVFKLQSTFDRDERAALVAKMSQLVLDDSPYIFFANLGKNYIVSEGVRGMSSVPSEYYFVTADLTVD